jgi:hypothetical protein
MAAVNRDDLLAICAQEDAEILINLELYINEQLELKFCRPNKWVHIYDSDLLKVTPSIQEETIQDLIGLYTEAKWKVEKINEEHSSGFSLKFS